MADWYTIDFSSIDINDDIALADLWDEAIEFWDKASDGHFEFITGIEENLSVLTHYDKELHSQEIDERHRLHKDEHGALAPNEPEPQIFGYFNHELVSELAYRALEDVSHWLGNNSIHAVFHGEIHCDYIMHAKYHPTIGTPTPTKLIHCRFEENSYSLTKVKVDELYNGFESLHELVLIYQETYMYLDDDIRARAINDYCQTASDKARFIHICDKLNSRPILLRANK